MADSPVAISDLARALAPWAGQGAVIEGLARMSGGASHETWAFDAVGVDGGRSELVLRRDPPGRPSDPAVIYREARALSLAAGAGLAVPELLFMSEGPGLGTAGMVMRRMPGETIARRILRDDAFGRAREVLVGQLGEFAAGLHAIEPPADFPRPDPVAELTATLATFDDHSPVFDLAIGRLMAEQPPQREPVLLHGDLRLGNVIVGADGLRAVLDWELTHLGNPAEDLGWLCVKAWRFGADPPAAGLGSRGQLLAAYRAAGGADISVAELRWWEILGTLRWGIICMTQAQAHLSGAHRSVELAAIGRRVCEQEWDLLLLLEPEAAAQAAARRPRLSGAGRAEPAPHGRPTASELLESVSEFLTGQVMPSTSGQLAFHARVAANVLGIVARELELGAPAAGDAPPPAGRRTSPAGDVWELADDVAARLAVANPRYFGAAPGIG
jgi:aminoglycoside phosphotransferase (APT) family kinase protein